MTGNNFNTKRRFVTCTELDRISYLPENLIDSILEKLPVQDDVRTHVLSKSWRYKWTTLSSLVLDKHFSEKFAKNEAFGHNGFITISNQIFNFLKGPLLKLHLHIPNMALDSFQEVDQWILSLSKAGVIRELVLTVLNQRYQLPCYFCCCLELRMLELENCIIKPPLDFQGFLYLKNLCLRNIEFGTNLHGAIMNLPQLKMLKLVACTNVYNFKIKSTKLFWLVVLNCPDATLHQLVHSKCLGALCIAIGKPIQGVERVNLASLLSNMPCLGDLIIDGYFLQGLQNEQLDVNPASTYLEASDCLDQNLNRLKTINIMHVERSRPVLVFIELLLHHSPILEKVSIRPSVTVDALEKYNFAKYVMQFPRASAKGELFYLDP
ncbi:F-box/FBD/LRR-repeat protein At1g13570-like [Rutidosis leptorrhynchoides]|uniref:F-box/FBD/LRR-repeat protein At1g13570-like n=1 Tax=Rutidosis leptorrhynchoides TaxID=125765 RepID=UPI003A9997E7